MQNRFLLILLLACQSVHARQPPGDSVSLTGTVTELISGLAVHRAEIAVFQRKVTFTRQGEPEIHGIQESSLMVTLLTDDQGRFATTLPLRRHTDYVYLVVSAPGMETLYKNLVVLTRQGTEAIHLQMTPAFPSAAEEQAIAEKTQAAYDQQTRARIAADGDHPPETAHVPTTESPSQPRSGPCNYTGVPILVYVKNLVNGYNGSQNGNGFTGFINFDEYVAGVVQGEIGGITTNLDTKKAQAIAARTFSQNRHELNLPVNIGQAYNDAPNASSLNAALQTSEEVVLYNNQIIDAKYAARCNGDYTQHATMGTWSPYTTCNTYGNFIPYLQSRPCSGHINCSKTSETPCCSATISTTNKPGYIFGHGVGMCQRGIEQLGEIYHLDYCAMLKRYYTNVCIANADCDTLNVPLSCADAVLLTPGVTYAGPASTAGSTTEAYGCNNWTETGPERVHLVTPDTNGILTATISNFTGDLDVYILGSCNPEDCLGTVTSNAAVFTGALKNHPYYIVVDADDGSGSAYELLVTIQTTVSTADTDQETAFSVFPNPTNDLLYFSSTANTVEAYDLLGRFQQSWQAVQMIDLGLFPQGVYVLKVTDRSGIRHTVRVMRQ